MQATIRAGVLKSLVECTKELWGSANFVFDEHGLQMQAMDSSHISLAHLALTREAFLCYTCPARATLGIQFDALAVALKACAQDDQLKMEFAVHRDHITIARCDGLRRYDLKLLDIEESIMCIPEQDYEVCANVPSSELLKLIRDLKELCGDTISISVQGRSLFCSVEGSHGRGTAVLRDAISADQSCEMGCELTCSYGLRFIAAFARGSPLCATVNLRFGKDVPLCVAYDIDEGKGSLTFYLASRIDDA